MATDKVNKIPTITILDCLAGTTVTREMTLEEISTHYPNVEVETVIEEELVTE